MTDKTNIFDSLSVIARGPSGRVKDARFLHTLFGNVWEFRPNSLYLRLVNDGDIKPDTFLIPVLFGSWSPQNA